MQQFHKFITWHLCVAQRIFRHFHAHHQEHKIALAASDLEHGGSSIVGKTRGS